MSDHENVRPRLPLWITIVSVLVALASVSVLVLVLYEETKGPAEILREFAERVDRNDCQGSYDLLDDKVRSGITQDQWCTNLLPSVDSALDADFALEQAVLDGDAAQVTISGVPTTTWELRRFGERSWRVVGPPEGFPFVAIGGNP
jgi:hypothetical protein